MYAAQHGLGANFSLRLIQIQLPNQTIVLSQTTDNGPPGCSPRPAGVTGTVGAVERVVRGPAVAGSEVRGAKGKSMFIKTAYVNKVMLQIDTASCHINITRSYGYLAVLPGYLQSKMLKKWKNKWN